ncbi:MAG TPA: hypothetical protein VKB93_00915 [Thermoanaerobaculia bacterium]|nr:hypothetical protein [Thermoanaerobaculia bacterium]
MKALDPLRAFHVLNRYRVRYVVVGGVARFLHGDDFPLAVLQIGYQRSPENHARLEAALRELASTPRDSGSETLKLNTDAGPLDCFGSPHYEEIERNAVQMAFDDVHAFVAT